MTPPDSVSRFVMTLDAQLPLERMLLARLQSLSGRSKQTWLRSLLTAGFLAECRVCQTPRESAPTGAPSDVSAQAPVPRSAPYTWPSARRFTGNVKAEEPSRKTRTDDTSTVRSGDKPFAYLRQVIG